MGKPKNDRIVGATETSLQIVKTLYEMDGARVDELKEEVDVSPSTVHRHLQTLRKHDYVVKQGDYYRLGMQFLTMGGYVRDRRAEYDLAKESCQDLAEKSGERVQFVVEEQGERVFVHTAIGEQAVRANGMIGRRGPLYCSAAGKAILAKYTDDQVKELVNPDQMEPITENTITDWDVLKEELDTIREEEIAFSHEESTIGLRAVASAVEMPDGEILGSLSISGPAHRMEGEWFTEKLPNLVRGAAQELELNIEYSKNV